MNLSPKKTLSGMLSSLIRVANIKPNDIPNVELYMDQVTTFMEKSLYRAKRYSSDKILTKTMINNYTKNNLLPPPDRKKYSRSHIVTMIFIYYFKNLISIADIDKLLGPLIDHYFKPTEKNENMDLHAVYKELYRLNRDEVKPLIKDLSRKFHIAMKQFPEVEGRYGEHLRYFTFICLLSFDVYIKKMIIEKLIDTMPPHDRKLRK